MELKLQRTPKNNFAKSAVLIADASPRAWLREIMRMGLGLSDTTVYPVPGRQANSLYGCLVIPQSGFKWNDIGSNRYMQVFRDKLFVPENTTVFPPVADAEWTSLFDDTVYIFHPDFGLAASETTVDWASLLELRDILPLSLKQPSKTVNIPEIITSLRIEVDPDKMLEQLQEPPTEEEAIANLPFDVQKILKGNQKEMDKFLRFMEQHPELALRYAIPLDIMGTHRGGNSGKFSFGNAFGRNFSLRKLFGKSAKPQSPNTRTSESTVNWPMVFRILFVVFVITRGFGSFSGSSGDNFLVFMGVIIFTALCIALVYGLMQMFDKNGSDFFRGGNSGGGSGQSALLDHSRFTALRQRYEKIAEDFVAQKEYDKAAHIYSRLLKNNLKAAQVLEEGQLYNEAATVYLKQCNNKSKAAECYEKGKAYNQAIALTKELGLTEKTGDLYVLLGKRAEANACYYELVEEYKKKNQYVKAALLLRNKIENPQEAQQMLMDGWRSDQDAFNCINNYFANIADLQKLIAAIPSVYAYELNERNKDKFLQALKVEFAKDTALQTITRELAYEIIAERIIKKPEIASELAYFNRDDRNITKDITKYKFAAKRRP